MEQLRVINRFEGKCSCERVCHPGQGVAVFQGARWVLKCDRCARKGAKARGLGFKPHETQRGLQLRMLLSKVIDLQPFKEFYTKCRNAERLRSAA